MKKYKIIIICIFTSVIFFLGLFVKATDYDVSLEDVNIDDLIYININADLSGTAEAMERMLFRQNFILELMYKNEYTLKIDEQNRIEINYKKEISPYIDRFKFLDYDNLKQIYILITFESKNTGIGEFVVDDERLIKINDNQFKFMVDIEHPNEYYDFNLWWVNALGEISDRGKIYYKSCKIIAEYNEQVNTLHDVGVNYDLLPLSDKKFIQINNVEKLGQNAYKIVFKKDNIYYGFNFEFDNDFNIDLTKIKNSSGWNMSYSSDGDTRLLYIQPDLNESAIPLDIENNNVDNPAKLMVGSIIVNLTAMTFDEVKTLFFDTVIDKKIFPGNLLYMWMFFEDPIEYIYNVKVKFEYRLIYAWMFSGGWNKIENIYAYDDESYTVRTPWWMRITTLGLSYLVESVGLLDIDKSIEKADVSTTIDKYNEYKKDLRFDENINGEDLTAYRVFLGQFNAFTSTNVHIGKYGVVEMTYLYKGVIYKVYEPDMNQHNVPDPDLDNMFFNFSGFFRFENVKDISGFFMHLVSFWKESIVVGLFLYFVTKIFRKRR